MFGLDPWFIVFGTPSLHSPLSSHWGGWVGEWPTWQNTPKFKFCNAWNCCVGDASSTFVVISGFSFPPCVSFCCAVYLLSGWAPPPPPPPRKNIRCYLLTSPPPLLWKMGGGWVGLLYTCWRKLFASPVFQNERENIPVNLKLFQKEHQKVKGKCYTV